MTVHRSLQDWLAYIQTVHFRSIDMSLDRVQAVLRHVAAPASFKIIAVAGTNGKGSCAAMLGAVLTACGYKTGVYTSPHLVRFNERIRIDGRPAGDGDLCRVFEAIESKRGDIPLTYFEFATLAAVLAFQRHGVEFAVMEVGMGGRLDAVNALPIDASLITNVELDHMHWLGSDREAIGREKAPVMRSGCPSVFNHVDPPRSVLDYAADIGTHLLIRGRDYRCEAAGAGWRWHGPNGEKWQLALPPMPGAVQVDNAAGVLALLAGFEGLGLNRETAERGLKMSRIHARCEIVAREPMVMIDVAHNLSAVAVLSDQLSSNPVGGSTTAVFGMLKDKDPGGVVRALGGLIHTWRLAGIRGERGRSAQELATSISSLVPGPVYCHPDAAHAYDAALDNAGADDRIVAFGSFHIAGDILDHMKRTP